MLGVVWVCIHKQLLVSSDILNDVLNYEVSSLYLPAIKCAQICAAEICKLGRLRLYLRVALRSCEEEEIDAPNMSGPCLIDIE